MTRVLIAILALLVLSPDAGAKRRADTVDAAVVKDIQDMVNARFPEPGVS